MLSPRSAPCKQNPLRETLLGLIDGATVANTMMPWGRPGPIRLPDEPGERAAMIDAHLAGGPADVIYVPAGKAPQCMHVESVMLAAFCPAADGLCRWLAVDLDAADGHGAGGLADPAHAARCLAERADAAGLSPGLLVARSRGGAGRHVFLLMPDLTPLADAVLALASLVAQAFKAAAADVADFGGPHAFATAAGPVAAPGQAGAVELIPRGTVRPALGWPLALPTPDRIIDPFTGKATELTTTPRCDPAAWGRFVADARRMLPRRMPSKAGCGGAIERYGCGRASGTAPRALDVRTRDFLEGRVAQGTRNVAAFAASCNLIGAGTPECEAERLVLAAAALCGLPEREAKTAFSSAVGTMRKRGRR